MTKGAVGSNLMLESRSSTSASIPNEGPSNHGPCEPHFTPYPKNQDQTARAGHALAGNAVANVTSLVLAIDRHFSANFPSKPFCQFTFKPKRPMRTRFRISPTQIAANCPDRPGVGHCEALADALAELRSRWLFCVGHRAGKPFLRTLFLLHSGQFARNVILTRF